LLKNRAMGKGGVTHSHLSTMLRGKAVPRWLWITPLSNDDKNE